MLTNDPPMVYSREKSRLYWRSHIKDNFIRLGCDAFLARADAGASASADSRARSSRALAAARWPFN